MLPECLFIMRWRTDIARAAATVTYSIFCMKKKRISNPRLRRQDRLVVLLRDRLLALLQL